MIFEDNDIRRIYIIYMLIKIPDFRQWIFWVSLLAF